MGIEYSCKGCRKDQNKTRLKKKILKSVEITMKMCGMCNKELEVSNFWKSCGYKDGYYKFCKPCGKKVRKEQQKDFCKSYKKLKKCGNCNVIKSVDNFGSLRASSDGLQHKCKDCTNKYCRKRKSKQHI